MVSFSLLGFLYYPHRNSDSTSEFHWNHSSVPPTTTITNIQELQSQD